MSDEQASANESPLSLRRLTSAFASMLGRRASHDGDHQEAAPREIRPDTRTITEAVLFVGRPDNQPLSADAIAATMRDVTPAEVQAAVAELNDEYESDEAAFEIKESAAGYCLALRSDFERVRQRFYGKVQQATLTPAAMEVLSVVAYRQPIEARTIDELRGQKSQSTLSTLVRRGLVRLDRSSQKPATTYYHTTDRFLQVFRLTNIDQLPQAQEFDAA